MTSPSSVSPRGLVSPPELGFHDLHKPFVTAFLLAVLASVTLIVAAVLKSGLATDQYTQANANSYALYGFYAAVLATLIGVMAFSVFK